VPVAIRVSRLARVADVVDRIDIGLVRVVPIPARQPDDLVIAHSDFDVVRGRHNPSRSETTVIIKRPGELEAGPDTGAERGDRLWISLVCGGIPRRIVEHQVEPLGGYRRGHCGEDVR
jgi:hypothetical protein